MYTLYFPSMEFFISYLTIWSTFLNVLTFGFVYLHEAKWKHLDKATTHVATTSCSLTETVRRIFADDLDLYG